MSIANWSTTPGDNDDADLANGIAFAEGQSPSQVNDSCRALMAVIKGDFANSVGPTGYQKFPNGLILQWGTASHATFPDYGVAFPVTFPTALRCVNITPAITAPTTTLYAVHADSLTTASFAVRTRYVATGGTVAGAVNIPVFWSALGY